LQAAKLLPPTAKPLAAALIRDGMITYFQAEQFLLGKWRGFTLGKYKLLERVGIGGMGQVFLCEDMLLRRLMALKVMPPTKSGNPAALGRFYREARVASALDHPNIVKAYAIEQDGPLHFLVMEYIDGTSLLEMVKKFGPLDPIRAAHYIRQAAEGLDYGHRAGMIHRDIKPGNIVVNRQGVAKLLDMGLARFYRDTNDDLTLKYDDKNILGTADYVAPEQIKDSRNIDIRADIYGLGATFFYLLTGRPPFDEPSVGQKLLAHQSKPVESLRKLRPEIPEALDLLVQKMMAKDVRHRPQTPAEVVQALAFWTRTPIAPPSADEMPILSPAATEGYVGQTPLPPPAAPVRDEHHVSADDLARSQVIPVMSVQEWMAVEEPKSPSKLPVTPLRRSSHAARLSVQPPKPPAAAPSPPPPAKPTASPAPPGDAAGPPPAPPPNPRKAIQPPPPQPAGGRNPAPPPPSPPRLTSTPIPPAPPPLRDPFLGRPAANAGRADPMVDTRALINPGERTPVGPDAPPQVVPAGGIPMPFFAQPIVRPSRNLGGGIVRWLYMTAISVMIGIILGVAIWSYFGAELQPIVQQYVDMARQAIGW
jgi:serine/threonine protein kinase